MDYPLTKGHKYTNLFKKMKDHAYHIANSGLNSISKHLLDHWDRLHRPSDYHMTRKHIKHYGPDIIYHEVPVSHHINLELKENEEENEEKNTPEKILPEVYDEAKNGENVESAA